MKKRLFFLFVLTLVLTGSFVLPAIAQPEIPVFIDGLPVEFDVPPVIQNGRTLVPFRAITAGLQVPVTWDGNTQTVTATDGKTAIRLQIGNKTAYRNSIPVTLDVPPQILDGRTLIPLRFLGEAFNCQVEWVAADRVVQITSPKKELAVVGFYALGDSKTSSWQSLFGRPYPETATGNTNIVGELALGWYSLDRDGNLLTRSRTGWQRPEGWEVVLEKAAAYNLATEMVIHVTDGDGTLAALLADEAAMTRAVRAVTAEADRYQGVNLDFEGLGFRDDGEQLKQVQQKFTYFVRLLATELKAADRHLTLTLHAPNSAYPGYDYETLGTLADRVIVMAYDYGSKPEPVSLVQQAVEQAAGQVPPEKLLLGISAATETPASLLTKVGLAKRYHLAGIALWRLGIITGEQWNTLQNTVQPRQ
ncbi:MAG: stalk domain-containing protein [Heliobacteriaceae bacterium]|nr:stalk domain-containing protein [Heliobacteriaceae bacterium]